MGKPLDAGWNAGRRSRKRYHGRAGASKGVSPGRGRIERGYFADRVMDTATYDDPRQFPVGIPYVLVNGQIAVDQERCTGVLAGRAVP